jgi:hypothetical protein
MISCTRISSARICFAASIKQLQLLRGLRAPSLVPGGVEESFLDGGFKRERETRRKRRQVVGAVHIPGGRHGNAQLAGELVSVVFVPGPLNRVPGRSGDTIELCQTITLYGKGRDGLIASRKEHPIPEAEVMSHDYCGRYPIDSAMSACCSLSWRRPKNETANPGRRFPRSCGRRRAE